jgi:long-chain acyl-CoA synthetase
LIPRSRWAPQLAKLIVADDAGTPLYLGEEGEICVKGPYVMGGYWQHPEAKSTAFTKQGYFRTGDIGAMNERGFVRICDRKKDMVLVSGFNVYPNEVEDVISCVPGVVECAVIGVPDAKTGEAVKALVVSKDANLTEAEIPKRCCGQLAAYKVPKIGTSTNSRSPQSARCYGASCV